MVSVIVLDVFSPSQVWKYEGTKQGVFDFRVKWWQLTSYDLNWVEYNENGQWRRRARVAT